MARNTTSVPSTWAHIEFSRANLIYDDEVAAATLSQSGPTHYVNRRLDGTIESQGTVSGTSLNFGSPGLGWRCLHLTKTGAADAVYGDAVGRTYWSVIKRDSRFITRPALSQAMGPYVQHDFYTSAMFGIGAERGYIQQANNALGNNFGQAYWMRDVWWPFAAASWNHPDYQDAARPHPQFVSFEQDTWSTAAHRQGVTDTVGVLHGLGGADWWFEGPSNEPQWMAASDLAARMKTFYESVKASNSSAKVLMPNPVDFNDYSLRTSAGNMDATITAYKALGGLDPSGVSVHGYNCGQNLGLIRRCWAAYEEVLTKHGWQNLTRWQTEHCPEGSMHNGVFAPRMQARRWMLETFMAEAHKLPKERWYKYYAREHGHPDWWTFWITQDGRGVLPAAVMHYTFSREVYGKTFTSEFPFTVDDENIYFGGLWTNAGTGDKVAAFITGGDPTGSVVLGITGASSVVVVDCWGNESTVQVTSGQITLTVPCEPVYVRLPSGVTATLRDKGHGRNWAPLSTAAGYPVATFGTSDRLQRVFTTGAARDSNPYFRNSGDPNHSEFPVWTQTFPASVERRFVDAMQLDTCRLIGADAWQEMSAPLGVEVHTLDADGTTWTQRATWTAPTPTTVAAVSPWLTSGSYVDDYWDGRCVVELTWTAVATKGVRVTITDSTYGETSTLQSKNAGGQNSGGKRACFREIQLYSQHATTRRVVVGN